MEDLATRLGIDLCHAGGILEFLWHFAMRYSPQGNIGKFSNIAIAKRIGWSGDPDKLADALVAARWLDHDSAHRLVIHDWPDHCDRSVKKYLAEQQLPFIRADFRDLGVVSVRTTDAIGAHLVRTDDTSGALSVRPGCALGAHQSALSYTDSYTDSAPEPAPVNQAGVNPDAPEEGDSAITPEDLATMALRAELHAALAKGLNIPPAGPGKPPDLRARRREDQEANAMLSGWLEGGGTLIDGKPVPVETLIRAVIARYAGTCEAGEMRTNGIKAHLGWMDEVLDGCRRGACWPGSLKGSGRSRDSPKSNLPVGTVRVW